MASTTITKANYTFNRRKFTISFWIKRTGLGADGIINIYLNSNNYSVLEFNSSDQLIFKNRGNSTTNAEVVTDAKFRDTNGWYHIVLRVDTFDATSSNRVRLYVNGVQQTNLGTNTQPSQDGYMEIGQSTTHTIGAGVSGGYWDGCISHFHITDGYSYAPTEFGETDSTTGEWKIKTSPSVTYGSGGTFILKDGNSVTDQSGNSNNWTVATGTLTKTEDCPSNVFCTMNPLDNYYAGSTFSNGNTTVATATSPYTYNTATMGMSSGKYYWELKWLSVGSGNSAAGIISTVSTGTNDEAPTSTDAAVYKDDGVTRENGSNGTSIGAVSANDIVSFAYDADNNFLYFAKNGVWQNSGDPTSGANGTGGYDPGNTPANTTTGNYFPFFSDHNSGGGYSASFNFGNGYFGTTAVSSAGTNASGNGIFEYNVPTGYTALSTKGLNT